MAGIGDGGEQVGWVSFGSGVDVGGAALKSLVGRSMVHELMLEGVAACESAFVAGWGEGPRRCRSMLGSELEEAVIAIRRKRRRRVVSVNIRCAPFSKATNGMDRRLRLEQQERVLEETQEFVRLGRMLQPDVVVSETASSICNFGQKWARLQAVLVYGWPEMEWGWQVVCPKKHMGWPSPRSRVWILGVKADISKKQAEGN